MEKMFFHVSCKWKVENSDDLYEYTKILIACFIKEGRGAVKQSELITQYYRVYKLHLQPSHISHHLSKKGYFSSQSLLAGNFI